MIKIFLSPRRESTDLAHPTGEYNGPSTPRQTRHWIRDHVVRQMKKSPGEIRSPNTPVDSAPGALEGIRVLDLSRVLAGPYCTMTLADLGADVIKVEHPTIGDETRKWGPPFVGEFSSYFLSVNRNKRSIGLDLSTPGGREALFDLLGESQILVENFRPASRSKLQLDPVQTGSRNAGIVHCHFYAYTPDGPASEYPGYDLSIQAESGLMSITGERDGPPTKVGVAIIDVCAGMHAATAILAAMLRRERTNQGEYIQVGLLDVAVASLVNVVQGHLVSGQRPLRYGNAHPNIVPYRDFQTKDLPIVVAAGNDQQWAALCTVLNLESWTREPEFATNDARVRNRETVESVLQKVFKEHPRSDWIERLRQAGVPTGPVNAIDEVLEDYPDLQFDLDLTPASNVSSIRSPLRLDQAPVGYRLPPPKLGQHTDEVLNTVAGYGEGKIAKLRREGAIK